MLKHGRLYCLKSVLHLSKTKQNYAIETNVKNCTIIDRFACEKAIIVAATNQAVLHCYFCSKSLFKRPAVSSICATHNRPCGRPIMERGWRPNRNLQGTCFMGFLVLFQKKKTKSVVFLKALVVKNSVLRDFGFGKVSHIHKTFLMVLQLFGWRHFSKPQVVQNTVLNH